MDTFTAEIDPRWQRLLGSKWSCRACEDAHEGLFDLACARPDCWSEGEAYAPNSAVATSTHFLSEDLCVLNDAHYFVRCVLPVPLIGAPGHSFAFGVWTTLSKNNFALYVDAFDTGSQSGLGPWFGWLSNRLRGYPDTLNLKCQVHPREGRIRPWLQLEATDHPLAVEQANGISLERLLDIYSIYGHPVEPIGFA